MTLSETAYAELHQLPLTPADCAALPEHHYEWLADWQFRLGFFIDGIPGGDPARVAEVYQWELEAQEAALDRLNADPRNRWPRDQQWLSTLRASFERVRNAVEQEATHETNPA